MRSVKRPRRPVRRYKSLLFPGAAVLAVFLFWAAFAPSERGGDPGVCDGRPAAEHYRRSPRGRVYGPV